MQRVLLAMSGGVDSSVSAEVLRRLGYEVVGAHMLLASGSDESARLAAKTLGIEFHTFDMRTVFDREVVEPFVSAYEKGLTPNPCVLCNKKLKFGALFDKADDLNCDFLATGHYARTSEYNGLKSIRVAADLSKDQSYVLYGLSAEQIERLVLPLGDMTKAEVRAIAAELGLQCADTPESQDICFVPDGDYAAFIESYRKKLLLPGDFVDPHGKKLGTHKGVAAYTIGQRRGLGLPLGDRAYVVDKSAENNTVVVGPGEMLLKSRVFVENVNFSAIAPPEAPIKVEAALRYNQRGQEATLVPLGGGSVRLDFIKAQRAPAPGQAAVFYDGEFVLGGGTISWNEELRINNEE